MTVIYTNQNNISPKNNAGQYDLNEERKIADEITEEIKEDLIEKWRTTYENAEIFPYKISAMHSDVLDFLLGFDLISIYDNIARQAGLDMKGRSILPQVVWSVAQSKKWSEAEQELQKRILLPPNTKALTLQLLEQNIISKLIMLSAKPSAKKSPAQSETERRIQLPLSEALQKYKELGEQNITINQLKLKYFPTPVRPSIRNWITDFHDNMGSGKHGTVDRANYLFHSENGKKLTPVERQKLSLILKSLDEKTPLIIDTELQRIIFTEGKVFPNEQTENLPSRSGQTAEINMYSKNEESNSFAAIEDNYLQVPKYQPPQENKKYSPNFKDLTEPSVLPEQKIVNSNQDDSRGSVVDEGKVSFSSPQKFSNEKENEKPIRPASTISQQKTFMTPTPQADREKTFGNKASEIKPWVIKPSAYFNEEKTDEEQTLQAKIRGNIVDLKG
ncbi:MAG TPA: hypothetical protein P5548_01250 [Candidatus Moranbacteria bacterium]|nr:hypothetical protein [Candidatus Moranbacteria bacterium]HRZ33518.1 hypothetical protein [Candidatus Moranbacteria bacterium]